MKPDWDVVDLCRQHLDALEPVRSTSIRTPVPDSAFRESDVSLSLETDAGSLHYAGSVLRGLRPSRLDHWLLLNLTQKSGRSKKQRQIILSDFVTDSMDQRLLDAGVDYVDAAGNLLLRLPGRLYVHRRGLRPPKRSSLASGRLLKPSGLQVLFVLLVEPHAIEASYRELAYRSGAALGSTAMVLNELKHKGFIVSQGKRRMLLHRRELLDLWITGYGGHLRPRLTIGSFQSPDKDVSDTAARLHETFVERQLDYALTGGFASDLITHHYRGNDLTTFVGKLPAEALKELRWLPSAGGRVTALRMFAPTVLWRSHPEAPFHVAHPLLVYAELLYRGGERERETAGIIYADHLARLVDASTR